MNLTTQGLITAIAQAIIIFSIILPFSPMAQRLGMVRFLVALVYAGVSVLIVYNTNCLEQGNCTIWAYIVAIMTLLGAIGTLGTTIIKGLSSSSDKNNSSSKENNNSSSSSFKENNDSSSSSSEDNNNSSSSSDEKDDTDQEQS